MSTEYQRTATPEKTDPFEVSEAWIRRHRTRSGGWTRRALAVLGETWPPSPGWIQRAVGKLITSHDRAVFEAQGQRRQAQQARLLDS